MRLIAKSLTVVALVVGITFGASAAEELPTASYEGMPASGKGPLVVLFSGSDGAGPYVDEAKAYVKQGYVAVLFDTSSFHFKNWSAQETSAESENLVRALIQRSLLKSEVQTSKTVVVGFSLGGGLALKFANRLPDIVSSVVAYYPATRSVGDPKEFLSNPRLTVPTLILAGVTDSFRGCCLIGKARELKAAADLPDVKVPLELHEYPDAGHVFNTFNRLNTYRSEDAEDAFRRSLAHIRKFSSSPKL